MTIHLFILGSNYRETFKYVKAMVFPVVMYGCEIWTIKKMLSTEELMPLNWGAGEDSKVPHTARRSNQSLLKEISPKYSLERLMLKLKLQYLAPDLKNWLIWKDPDAGKDWRQEEEEMTEDEMVGWHYQLNRHEFQQASGTGDGQASLACCSPRGCKVSDTTERLNWK